MSSETIARWRWHALALLFLLAVGALRWNGALRDPRLAVDESDYTAAFTAISHGENPYEVPRFIYPPAFAVVGAAAAERWGEMPLVYAFRVLNLLGAAVLIWLSLSITSWSYRIRVGLGAALIALWAPIHQGIDCGNISLAVIGLTLAAMAAIELRSGAAIAGLGLGLGLVIKPLAPAVLALLGPWRSSTGKRVGRRVAALAALTAAALSLALGRSLLPVWLAKTGGHLPNGHTVSLWRLLFCVGIDVRPALLLVVVLAVTVPWVWKRELSSSQFLVVATTATLYSLPLVWTHTLAFSLPAQLAAFDRALSGSAASGESDRRQRRFALAILAALALSIQGSEALVAINNRSLLIQALYLAPAVLAPAAFAVYALRGRVPRAG